MTPSKYVVVLAHADGWGALSANKMVRYLHKHYPDIGVHLIVSQATKNKEGKIATKLDDLKTSRELKETNLLEYFKQLDAMYDAKQDMKKAKLLTFKQLAKECCADGQVHYTTRGGPIGGEEAAAVISGLETHYSHGPEVLLSVDTMAILPKTLLERYQCFSTHPGPLDTIKIEGMQGTLRSLANQVLYDRNAEPLPADHVFGMGMAHLKGTLFMQHPELDKGPPIASTLSFICPGICAYQARDEVYDALTDKMAELLPTILDKDARAALVEKATKEKAELDAQPHKRIPELDAQQFATWQGNAVGIHDEAAPWGVEVIQNTIIDPQYFKNQMRGYFPGKEQLFEKTFTPIYGANFEKLASQRKEHLKDAWARLYSGDPHITITQHDPKTGKPIATYKNR